MLVADTQRGATSGPSQSHADDPRARGIDPVPVGPVPVRILGRLRLFRHGFQAFGHFGTVPHLTSVCTAKLMVLKAMLAQQVAFKII